jgi:release factor glutamine methyltransferase
MPPETLRALLEEGRRALMGQGIETAALDARLLLQAACGVSHETIVAEADSAITSAQAESYRDMIARRAAHMPVSRIVGTREFYGRRFVVTPAVLDPRPDTETLIEAVVELLREERPFRFIDLGTGSGAIAVMLLCELPQARGVATDISADALAVARANAERHGVADRLSLAQSSWFQGLSGQFDLIVSNPPYIALGDIDRLEPEVRVHDPRLALDGGPDGLEAYRRIAAGAAPLLAPGGQVAVEIGAGQEGEVAVIFEVCGFRHAVSRRDIAGRPRCMVFHREGEVLQIAQRKVG